VNERSDDPIAELSDVLRACGAKATFDHARYARSAKLWPDYLPPMFPREELKRWLWIWGPVDAFIRHWHQIPRPDGAGDFGDYSFTAAAAAQAAAQRERTTAVFHAELKRRAALEAALATPFDEDLAPGMFGYDSGEAT
jgi:hypothetical protein